MQTRGSDRVYLVMVSHCCISYIFTPYYIHFQLLYVENVSRVNTVTSGHVVTDQDRRRLKTTHDDDARRRLATTPNGHGIRLVWWCSHHPVSRCVFCLGTKSLLTQCHPTIGTTTTATTTLTTTTSGRTHSSTTSVSKTLASSSSRRTLVSLVSLVRRAISPGPSSARLVYVQDSWSRTVRPLLVSRFHDSTHSPSARFVSAVLAHLSRCSTVSPLVSSTRETPGPELNSSACRVPCPLVSSLFLSPRLDPRLSLSSRLVLVPVPSSACLVPPSRPFIPSQSDYPSRVTTPRQLTCV